MSITYSACLESYSDLDNLLWSGARDKWSSATDEVKEAIWALLESYGKFHSLTEINDFIWFECDDIFYTDEED